MVLYKVVLFCWSLLCLFAQSNSMQTFTVESAIVCPPMEYSTSSPTYVHVPDGTTPMNTDCTTQGGVTFGFFLPQPAEIHVRYMVAALNPHSNSFFVRMDDEDCTVEHVPYRNPWGAHDSVNPEPVWHTPKHTYQMQPGAHSLVVTHREDGLRLFEVQFAEDAPYNCSLGQVNRRHACVEQGSTQETNYCPRLIAIISGIYWLVIIVGLIHMSRRGRTQVIASQVQLEEKT